MKERKALLAFAEIYKNSRLVLATLIETQGSTYSKPGAKKLIAENGESCGMLSGGCLEGEIIELALKEISRVKIHDIDTRDESDRFFGTGVGCQGLLRILFEPVDYSDAEQFARTYLAYDNKKNGISLCCISPESENYGKRRYIIQGNSPQGSPDDSLFREGAPASAGIMNLQHGDYFVEPWQSDLHVTIFGAGLDVEPLKELIECMGWSLKIYEHRREWLDTRVSESWPIQFWDCNPENIMEDYKRKTVLLLMSHSYEQDMKFLYHWIQLNNPADYIGILGPEWRKEQMCSDLVNYYHLSPEILTNYNLHGPVGDKGCGRGSQAIAISITVELQKIFFGENDGNGEKEALQLASNRISL